MLDRFPNAVKLTMFQTVCFSAKWQAITSISAHKRKSPLDINYIYHQHNECQRKMVKRKKEKFLLF